MGHRVTKAGNVLTISKFDHLRFAVDASIDRRHDLISKCESGLCFLQPSGNQLSHPIGRENESEPGRDSVFETPNGKPDIFIV